MSEPGTSFSLNLEVKKRKIMMVMMMMIIAAIL
jgi:hypothetical protein